MKTSLQIATGARLEPIGAVADRFGIPDRYVEWHGRYKAKIDLNILDESRHGPAGKYILVTAITPTPLGEGKTITTIEAIGETPSGEKIQKAWLNVEVVQCGYCQSGQIMSAAALIESNPNPNDAEIDAAMSGNICRCGTYPRIRAAIKQASQSA